MTPGDVTTQGLPLGTRCGVWLGTNPQRITPSQPNLGRYHMNGVQLRATRKRVVNQISEVKTKVAKDVARILEDRQLTQTQASYETGEAPSQISLVVTGKLRGFSLERLLRMRAMLGAEINLEVTSSTRQSVSYAFN